MTKKSKWNVTMEEKNGEFIVTFDGKSNATHHLLGLEALCRGLKSWGHDVNFKDGTAPDKISKKWILPTKKVKAKLNPHLGGKKKSKKSKKTKVDNDAIDLYRQFNGTEPTEIVSKTVWLPDENSPLVALGEGDCPFIGYTSAKTNKKGEKDDYIHHFGEEGGQPPKLYVTCPPPGYERIMMIIGGDWKIEERADGKLWLVD